MSIIGETIAAIQPLDLEAERTAQQRLDSLTKPPGSLGHLENLVRRYAAIRHDGTAALGHQTVVVFVADHGIAAEGVSAYPQTVTGEMLRNFARGGAAISVLARHLALDLRVVDVGVAIDTRAEQLENVVYHRIASGTANFRHGPAMTPVQAHESLALGISMAQEIAASDTTLIGIGEMGIANSTAAAALLAALTGIEPRLIAGRGAGLDESGWRHKVEIIEDALALHSEALSVPESILAAVGGLEIGAMTGVCLGAAARQVPVVVDGFIATAAAALAERFRPGLTDHLFFSHRSAEGGHGEVLARLGARPILDLNLRLGEGTGAALAMVLIRAALATFNGMATFEEAGISPKPE